MSDHETRTLERSLGIGGQDDRVAWLAARLRTGELDPGALELAAFMGAPAARVLCPGAPTWSPMRHDAVLTAWGGFPALAGCLALLRRAIERASDPVPGRVHDLAGAAVELLATPSEEWFELIGCLPEESGARDSTVDQAAHHLRSAVGGLERRPEQSARELGRSLAQVPAHDRAEAEAAVREAIARRALAGAWQAEARWLEERVADFWLDRPQLALLRECGFPAPLRASPAGELRAWLEGLLVRGLDLSFFVRALLDGIDSLAIELDSEPCLHCAANDASAAGRPPEEVVEIRGRALVRAVAAGALEQAELDLWWKLELARQGAPLSLSLEDALRAADAVGHWLARRRIAAAVVAKALRGPEDKNFGRHARRRRRRAGAADGAPKGEG